jgi:Ser/Thr protein kinase RdoA (MazF antagonist)
VELTAEIESRVLPCWEGWSDARVEPIEGGLINRTFLVVAAERRGVLQKVSPIFPPGMHEYIRAVTACLARAGLPTPELVPTRQGALWVAAAGSGGGVWRMETFIEGACFDRVGSAAQAHAAGALVARFHRALDGLDHAFVHVRAGAHDPPRHLDRLAAAVAAHAGHRLAALVQEMAREMEASAASLPSLPPLPPRVCHGDLKFSNVRFAGAAGPASEQAVCLIDLDTVGPMLLAFELGDAWRSWCNRNGEDQAEAALDLEVFRASLEGYLQGIGRALGEDERRALLVSAEWISLELAARFAADALEERYFGWDPARYAGRGEHNLLRARGQLSLHRAFVATRAERAKLLGLVALPRASGGG